MQGEMDDLKTAIVLQDHEFKDKFDQLIDVTKETQRERDIALYEIRHLRDEVTRQRIDYHDKNWWVLSRDAHLDFENQKKNIR